MTLLFAALMALLALPATASRVDSWTSHYPLAPGGRVSVENVQGSIMVEAWDRAQVQLTVIKKAPGLGAALDDVQIVVQPSPGWLRVQTLYAGGSDEEDPVTVDFRLRVPRQAQLEGLRTVNGNIVVRQVEGSVEARTLNGHIKETGVAGSLTARTLNGNISVSLRDLPEAPGSLQLESINGHVTLLLPPEADADLDLSTVAGRIENQAPFTARAVPGENSARARLGRGGVQVRLRTVRGNIRVAERDDLL
jgi:hypothetical protein